uniref:Uncharacterized protein n=1 Tax=Romanomermis culicivorax TaxID=13658 RepID=A0A915ILZ3_ROMCU
MSITWTLLDILAGEGTQILICLLRGNPTSMQNWRIDKVTIRPKREMFIHTRTFGVSWASGVRFILYCSFTPSKGKRRQPDTQILIRKLEPHYTGAKAKHNPLRSEK